MKNLLVVLLLLLTFSYVHAQNTIVVDGLTDKDTNSFQRALVLENGVKAFKEIDRLYDEFFKGYVELNPKIVADLYSEDALYLVPDQEIIKGRTAILENFTSFFDSMKDRGQKMTISFQILQRKVEKNLGYDVGIYTINYSKDGVKLGESKGKFVVVAVKDKDGKWRFQVDGYSALKPQENN